MSQYIAMNRFRIVKGQESEFEEIWKTRNTYLENEPGFVKFNLDIFIEILVGYVRNNGFKIKLSVPIRC